jgi:hypothetical protein
MEFSQLIGSCAGIFITDAPVTPTVKHLYLTSFICETHK